MECRGCAGNTSTRALGVVVAAFVFIIAADADAEYRLQRTFFDVPGATTKVDVTGYLDSYRGAIKGDAAVFTHRSGKAVAVFKRVDKTRAKRATRAVLNALVDEHVKDKTTKVKGKRERINKMVATGMSGTGTRRGAPCKWVAYFYVPKRGKDAVVALGAAPSDDTKSFAEVKKFVRGVFDGRK